MEPLLERLFLAIPLPDAVQQAIARVLRPISGVAWTRTEQLHLTLRFLGDVDATRRDVLVERLASVKVDAFVLPVEGVGVFPPNRPARVVWVGTGRAHPRLFQLRQRIDDTVLAAGLDVDVRHFQPHITVGRCGDSVSPALSHWLHDHREFVAPPFRVEAFDLYGSELKPSGAVHTLKRRFGLQS